jgi:hypothetical protein
VTFVHTKLLELHMKGAFAALAACCLFGTGSALAVPAAVPYFGRLTFESGVPYSGSVAVSVALFEDAAASGTPLWGPHDLGNVAVEDGALSLLLGGPGTPPLDTALLASAVWLQVSIGGTPMLPTQQVLSVPYALRARDAERLGGVQAAQYAKTANLAAVATGGASTHLSDSIELVRLTDLADVALTGDVNDLVGDPTTSSLANAFVKRIDGSLQGDMNAAYHRILDARMRVAATPPVGCDASKAGLYYFDSTLGALRICDGSLWQGVSGTPVLPTLSLGSGTLTVGAISGAVSPGACTNLTLQNTGAGPATGVALSPFSGANPTNFEACVPTGAACGTTLAAGASCNFGVRLVATENGTYTGVATVIASGGISVTRALAGTAAGFSLSLSNAYPSTDAATGNKMWVVPVPNNRSITTSGSYHSLCQDYGLSAYGTTDNNASCGGPLLSYPKRVGTCNMGLFNHSGWDYRFDGNVPTLGRVYWLSVINGADTIGLEYNGVGPCSAGEQIGACGTGALNGSGNGIRHSKNPIYGANYNVQNVALVTTDYVVCAGDPLPAPALNAGTGTLAVGNISGGVSPGACTSLTVQNTGNAPATGLTLGAFTGANPASFGSCAPSSAACGTTLAAGASCNFGIRLAATSNGNFSATANVTASGGFSASRAVSASAAGFPFLPLTGAFSSNDASTGNVMWVVPVPSNRTITTLASYHALCQEYGMTVYGTTDSNASCGGPLNAYPKRVGSCNMGHFNQVGWDYRFNGSVPTLSRVYWMSVINGTDTIGLEYNAVGPCGAGEQIGACGTGSLNGSGNGIRHSKNPIYGANYNVQNVTLTTSDFVVCAAP